MFSRGNASLHNLHIATHFSTAIFLDSNGDTYEKIKKAFIVALFKHVVQHMLVSLKH